MILDTLQCTPGIVSETHPYDFVLRVAMALRTATLKDGATTTHIKFGSAASLLQKLKTKGWKPEQGDVVKLPGDIEVLAEDDVPEGGDLNLELVRLAPLGKLVKSKMVEGLEVAKPLL